MKTPLRSRDVNIKPRNSVGVTNGAVLRNEVQYQKAVFYWVLKLIQDCFGFAEKSRQPLKKSSAKLKAIAAWWFTFYALSWLWIPIGCEQFKSSVKSNRDFFGFPSLRSVIGLENSHLDQSDTKQNPSATRSLLFSPPLKKFASRALHLTVSFLLLSDVIAQYAGTLCMVSSSSNFSDSGNRGFKPRFWTQARILRYRVLKLSESRNV